MAAIDLSILYNDYINNCKHLNIIPLCMTKWYDKFYGNYKNDFQQKKYNSIEEVLDEINKLRARGILY